jgi:hypothetical protein
MGAMSRGPVSIRFGFVERNDVRLDGDLAAIREDVWLPTAIDDNGVAVGFHHRQKE